MRSPASRRHPGSPRFKEAARIAGVFGVALGVRMIALHLTFSSQFFFGKYLVLGRRLHETGLIADRPFSYGPVYCYFIALCKTVFGDALYPIFLVQALIGAGTCVLIYLIARHLVGGRWALLAAGIACFYRSFVLYEVSLLPDFLGLFLLLALLAALYRKEDEKWLAKYLLVGALLGLCILQRPNSLILVPAVLVVMVLKKTTVRAFLQRGAVLVFTAAVVVAPLTLQNFRLTGTPGITASNPGYILYSSNNPFCYGFRYNPPGLYFLGRDFYDRQALREGPMPDRYIGDAEIATAISGAIAGRPMSVKASSEFYMDFTLSHMSRYPRFYLKLPAQRLWLTFNALEPHDVLPVRARYDTVARFTPFTYGLIVPLGLFGLALTWRRWRDFLWTYVIVVNQLILLLVFYVVVRFRLPIEAVMIITSVLAVKTLWEWVGQRETRKLVLGGLSLVVLVAGSRYLPVDMAERARGKDLDHLLEIARRDYRAGNEVEAARRLETLIRRDTEELPRIYQARQLLAEVSSRSGGSPAPFDKARVTEALERKRRQGTISFQEVSFLGYLYQSDGAWQRAEAVLAEALERRPPDPIARYELARTELSLNEDESARTRMLAAIDDGLLFTRHGMHGCYLLARIYQDDGDAAQAAAWTQQASRQSILMQWNPGDREWREILDRLRTFPGHLDPGNLEDLIPSWAASGRRR